MDRRRFLGGALKAAMAGLVIKEFKVLEGGNQLVIPGQPTEQPITLQTSVAPVEGFNGRLRRYEVSGRVRNLGEVTRWDMQALQGGLVERLDHNTLVLTNADGHSTPPLEIDGLINTKFFVDSNLTVDEWLVLDTYLKTGSRKVILSLTPRV